MKKVLIENGIVIDSIVADEDFTIDNLRTEERPMDGCQLVASEDAQIGWYYDGKNFTPPPAPEITYAQKRASEYPPFGDQLDSIWKFIEAAGKKMTLPPEAESMLEQILEVKERHPKE